MTPVDDPAVETKTGAAVDGLIEAIREDMGAASDLLRRAAAIYGGVAVRGRGVNGLAVACNGFGDLLRGVIAAAEKEVADVERKYNGTEATEPMHEAVDEEHAKKVLAARASIPDQQRLEEA